MNTSPKTQGLPPAQALLPQSAEGDRPLLAIMAVMAFLAGLALLTTVWASNAGRIWTSGLEGRMTVQVLDPGQAEAAVAAVDAIAGLSAERLDEAAVDALLAPWLGSAELPDDIPVPALIQVDGEGDPSTVAARLAAAGVEADVDDHQRWANRVRGTARWVRLGAFAVFLLILGAGAATSRFATEAAMRAEETVIRVLGQVGAQDRFVSRLFVERFFFAGLKAGAVGAVAAAVIGVLLGIAFGAPFGFGWGALMLLLALPFAFGGVAAWNAGRMATRQLELERAAR